MTSAPAHDSPLPVPPTEVATESFLALICHELRTPLQTVLGQGEMLLRESTDDVARARLAAIGQHGALMLRLVNDLLDWHASAAGEFRLVPQAVDLPALVAQTVESCRPVASARRLALECRMAADAPRWVELDGDRVRQVLLNLLGNAIKFTEVGGVCVTLTAANDGGAELQVTDTGPGIAPAEQARIFRPFARVERTAGAEGAGLGLALSARLCARLGGALTVQSDGRSGTTFFARFAAPACRPLVVADAAPVSAPALRGRRVLVAEDNALVRELFVAHFAQLGAHCEWTSDGEQALARATENEFAVVVLDLSMPGLDGFEVARRLRARRGTAVRIVGASAHAGPTERTRALAAGMDAFLAKPVELGALTAALGLEDFSGGGEGDGADTAGLRAALVAQFRSEARGQLAALDRARHQRDWPALAQQAHYVHNSALVVGDDALGAACVALWDAALDGDEEAARRAWEKCRAALSRWAEPPRPQRVAPCIRTSRTPTRQGVRHRGECIRSRSCACVG